MNYGAVRCDDLRLPGYSMVFRYQCRRPVVGQYVTIRNFDFTQIGYDPGKYFMMEINEIIILGKSKFFPIIRNVYELHVKFSIRLFCGRNNDLVCQCNLPWG